MRVLCAGGVTRQPACTVQWSPDGSCLAVWDSPLEYGVCLYAADGEYLAQYSAYTGALGVKAVAWAPSGQLLAVGSFDQARYILPFPKSPVPRVRGGRCTALLDGGGVNGRPMFGW